MREPTVELLGVAVIRRHPDHIELISLVPPPPAPPTPPPGFTEGPPRTFAPVCKHPRDYIYTTGPVGYEETEDTPLVLVEPRPTPPATPRKKAVM